MVYDIILSEWVMGLLLDLLDMQCDMYVAKVNMMCIHLNVMSY